MLEYVNRVGLRHAAVGERQFPELANDEIDAGTRFPREKGSRVRTDKMRAGFDTPHAKTSAPTPQIEDDFARPHVEKPLQHRVPDGSRQERRRHRFVTAVGVKALVQEFRCLIEGVTWAQYEKIRRSVAKRSAACGTLQARWVAVEPSATIGTSDDLKELRRD